MEWLLIAGSLILVHGPEGQVINVHVPEITTIRTPRKSEGHFAKGTHCLIYMTNSQFIATTETCEEIVEMVHKAEKDK